MHDGTKSVTSYQDSRILLLINLLILIVADIIMVRLQSHSFCRQCEDSLEDSKLLKT